MTHGVTRGMIRERQATKGGDDLSQVVKAAAECVTRSPPLGNEDPSVSPWKSLSWGKQACTQQLSDSLVTA